MEYQIQPSPTRTGHLVNTQIPGSSLQFIPLILIKPDDESITSSDVLQDDNDFVFFMRSHEQWVGIATLSFGNALQTTGLQISFTFPSGATSFASASVVSSTGVSRQGISNDSGTPIFNVPGTVFGTGSVTVNLSFRVLNGTTPGNMQFQWAQGTSSATALIFHQGNALFTYKVIG